MRITKRRIIAGTTVGAAAVAAVVVPAVASSNDDDARERPITGTALERAAEAALTHLGEGRVTGTEVDDEESYYEVEVTLDDGRRVDVQLDRTFNIVGSAGDEETSDK